MSKMANIEVKWTVPNVLSLVRLLLLPVFAVLYLNDRFWWALVTLLLSGATDALDGYIARKYNQITDFGKLLDPVADKMTQVTVILCLATKYPRLWTLVLICFAKEILQVIGGCILLHNRQTIRGAKWFGKVSTFVFYGAMATIVLWKDMPGYLMVALIVLVAAAMLFAFFGYLRLFFRLRKDDNATGQQTIRGLKGENTP